MECESIDIKINGLTSLDDAIVSCYFVQLKRLFIIVVHISSSAIFYERHLEIRLFYCYQAFLVLCNSIASSKGE